MNEYLSTIRINLIVYYVPRRIMTVITRRATMLARDRSQGVAETKPRQSRYEAETKPIRSRGAIGPALDISRLVPAILIFSNLWSNSVL